MMIALNDYDGARAILKAFQLKEATMSDRSSAVISRGERKLEGESTVKVKHMNKNSLDEKKAGHVINDSFDRIKSLELDLEKTKQILHATVMKQKEMEETLEAMKESSLRRRNFEERCT